jgi:hypothetical protein
MLGLGLWYVGFVLIIIALWMLGKIQAKAVIPMTIFVAAVQLGGVFRVIWTGVERVEFLGAALTCLFAFTYLYLAATQIWNLDVKALGWYSLLVAIIAVPAGFLSLATPLLALLWFMWASLWFMFFLLLALGKKIDKVTAWWTLINGVWLLLGSVTTLMGVWEWW